MPFVAQRHITESNRPPSYLASASEQESNLHFLSWWPVLISGLGTGRWPPACAGTAMKRSAAGWDRPGAPHPGLRHIKADAGGGIEPPASR